MRLIHTSDWHLGKSLHGYSRSRDHEQAISDLLEKSREYQPDLIIHAGDLFDTFSPPVSVMEAATEYLRSLSDIAPVAILRGNHDSPHLFRFLERVMGGNKTDAGYPGIRFFDEGRPAEEGGTQSYPVTSTGGRERIRLFPLPFVHAFRKAEKPERFFEKADDGEAPGFLADYQSRLRWLTRYIEEEFEDPSKGYRASTDLPVYAAHLMVEGAKVSGSERAAHTTTDYATSSSHIPSNALYSALGHIHRPQTIDRQSDRFYSGSPVELDFGEAGEDKGAVFVERPPKGTTRAEFAALSKGTPLKKLEGTLDELERKAAGGEGRNCYLWVTVRTDKPERDLASRAAAIFDRASVVKVTEDCSSRKLRALSSSREGDNIDTGSEGSSSEALKELFAEYLRDKGLRKGAGVSAEEMQKAFEESAGEDLL